MNNMIKLDCQWLQQQTFSNCYQVKTVSGEDAICVQTYNRWSDDSLLTFYIIQCGNKLLITDEAESIFHFRTVGLLENKRNWRGIQEKLNGTKTDIQLEQDGEIFTLCHPDRAATAIADFISALCAIMHYERELLALPAETVELAEEVERYLRLWKPDAQLIRDPKVYGISGHSYSFDFQFNNQLILAISPTPNAVGAVMRKAGDVISGNDLNGRKITVIVDNRTDKLFAKHKAEEEIQIISALVNAVPLTNLINQAIGNAQTAH